MVARTHFTVNVQVKEVTPAHSAKEEGKGQYGALIDHPRNVEDVVSVTTRASTKSEAVEKAVRMLEAEGEDDSD